MNTNICQSRNQPATSASNVTYVTPRTSVTQSGDTYTLQLELPGVSKDGVELTVDDGNLTLVGHQLRPQREASVVYHERQHSSYRRVFELDPSIDQESISASLEQGVLTVTLHKAEAAKARNIQVN